jgi:NADPH-dependent 2,4-dienoyl-CoA reductase/sulfur reductase-like enzyme
LKQDTICNKANKSKRASPAITTDIECKILIIGGGLAGLSLAYELDRNDASFVLIEANRIGDAASGVNEDFVHPVGRLVMKN